MNNYYLLSQYLNKWKYIKVSKLTKSYNIFPYWLPSQDIRVSGFCITLFCLSSKNKDLIKIENGFPIQFDSFDNLWVKSVSTLFEQLLPAVY